ncbi:MAG: hypothetical protein AAFU53_16485 [Cyanobacteria bacterium J06632_3]
MKYLLAVLTTAFLLISCSADDASIDQVISQPAEETASESSEEAAVGESGEDTEESIEANSEESDTESNEEDDSTSDNAGIDQKNVKLVVENQTTAGQIIVKQVATSRDGWVSVHKSQEGGGIQLPDSIGEARVDSGDSEDIIVDLWEAPAIDEKLWVLLHIDNGERGLYEFPEKDPAVRRNGETMARSFVIQDPNPEEEDADE